MADQLSGIGIIDAIALIRELLVDHLSRDAQSREEIENIRRDITLEADAKIIERAREIARGTEARLDAFIERLEDTEPTPPEKPEE